MALLSPTQIHPKQIKAAIEEAAIAKVPETASADSKTLQGLLAKHQLTADDALESLADVMRSGESAAIRHRATETALKLNGMLDKDSNKQDFHVTINILDSEFKSMNPILLPR